MTRVLVSISGVLIGWSVVSAVVAQPTEEQRISRQLTARDLCLGPIAKFANTPDPDSEVSYDQGKFKIIRSKQGITVLEENIQIAQFHKFDYSNYIECLDKFK